MARNLRVLAYLALLVALVAVLQRSYPPRRPPAKAAGVGADLRSCDAPTALAHRHRAGRLSAAAEAPEVAGLRGDASTTPGKPRPRWSTRAPIPPTPSPSPSRSPPTIRRPSSATRSGSPASISGSSPPSESVISATPTSAARPGPRTGSDGWRRRGLYEVIPSAVHPRGPERNADIRGARGRNGRDPPPSA